MSILFTPVRVGSLTVPNRFVRSATHAYLAEAKSRKETLWAGGRRD